MTQLLSDQVEHFLYTHPVQHHKKALIELVRSAEEAYLRTIAELKNDLAQREPSIKASAEKNRMASEGGPADLPDYLQGTRYYDEYCPD